MYTRPALSRIATLWLLSRRSGRDLAGLTGEAISELVKMLTPRVQDFPIDDPVCAELHRVSPYPLHSLVKTKVSERDVTRAWLPLLRAKPADAAMGDFLAQCFVDVCRQLPPDKI